MPAKDYRDLWKSMQSAGVPLLISSDQTAPDLVIDCDGGGSFVQMLSKGGTAYVLYLHLRNISRRTIILEDWELHTPWPDSQLHCLDDPGEGTYDNHYLMPGRIQFPRDQVLNHRVDSLGRLRPSEAPLEGYLLLFGHAPVPSTYGCRADLQLVVRDTSGRSFEISLRPIVERPTASAIQAVRKRLQSSGGLFDREIPAQRNHEAPMRCGKEASQGWSRVGRQLLSPKKPQLSVNSDRRN